MIRFANDARAAGLAAVCLGALAMTGAAKAEQEISASALAVRHAVVAMAAADAALPFASAVETAREADATKLAPDTVSLKPETADALAAVRGPRRQVVAAEPYFTDRRYLRPYREPFVLMLGIGY